MCGMRRCSSVLNMLQLQAGTQTARTRESSPALVDGKAAVGDGCVQHLCGRIALQLQTATKTRNQRHALSCAAIAQRNPGHAIGRQLLGKCTRPIRLQPSISYTVAREQPYYTHRCRQVHPVLSSAAQLRGCKWAGQQTGWVIEGRHSTLARLLQDGQLATARQLVSARHVRQAPPQQAGQHANTASPVE